MASTLNVAAVAAILLPGGALAAGFPEAGPASYSVIQRSMPQGDACGSSLGCGSVPIDVLPTASSTSYVFRLRDASQPSTVLQGWTPLASDLGSGFRVPHATVPASLHGYLIDVRVAASSDAASVGSEVDGTQRFLVGDLSAVFGQSIAVAAFLSNTIGADGGAPGQRPAVPLLASIGVSAAPSYCAEMADYGNNLSATWQTTPSAGTTNPVLDGSGLPVWGPIADGSPSSYDSAGAVTLCVLAAARTGVAQGIIGYAVGNSQIADWAPGQPDYARFLRIVGNATAYQAQPAVAHVAWIQGQADGASHPSAATYEAALDAILSGVRSHVASNDVSVSTIQAMAFSDGVGGTHPEYDPIRWGGMEEVARLRLLGTNAAYVDGLDMVEGADLIHPSQAVGAPNLAKDFYRAIADAAGPKPLAITGASLAGDVVTLSLANAGSTLVLSGPVPLADLFTIYPTGIHTGSPLDQLPVASAAITGPSTIRLVLAAAPAEAVDVYYREPEDAGVNDARTTITNNVLDPALGAGQQLALPTGVITTTGQPTGAAVAPPPTPLALASAVFEGSDTHAPGEALSGGTGSATGALPTTGGVTISTWFRRPPLGAALPAPEMMLNADLPSGLFGDSGFNIAGVGCTVAGAPHECLDGSFGDNTPYGIWQTTRIDDGQWHQVALSVGAAAVTIFLDGRQIGNATGFAGGGGMLYRSSLLTVGAFDPAGLWHWGGDLQDVVVGAGTLNAAQAATLFESGTVATPVQRWPLDGTGEPALPAAR